MRNKENISPKVQINKTVQTWSLGLIGFEIIFWEGLTNYYQIKESLIYDIDYENQRGYD